MKALILAGGFGTRLQSIVADRPKPLALVNDEKTFLDLQIQFLIQNGITEVILLTHYMHEKFVEHFSKHKPGISISFIREAKPLGTGGSLLTALQKLSLTEPFLLLNGDSFLNFDLAGFLKTPPKSSLSFVVSKMPDTSRFGTVTLNAAQELISFKEKEALHQEGLVNAGIYFINPIQLTKFTFATEHKISLETDIIPTLLHQGELIKVSVCNHEFVDIGTPESYDYFRKNFQKLTKN